MHFRKKAIITNLMLFVILYFSVSFNKEYIPPIYGENPIIGILTGSYSNFIAAYIISLFSISPILKRKISKKISRIIFYIISTSVFILLTIEEINPFTQASKTFDIYDIIASGIGSLLAIVTFEIIIKKQKNRTLL